MTKPLTMHDIFQNPRYQGKHVILAAGKVYATKEGNKLSELVAKIRKKHPNVTPEYAYLPPKGTILIV